MVEQTTEQGDDPLIGRVLLDRYRIVRLLGEGGMGKVYLAEQKMGTATRNVAIKTLLKELSGDAQIVARFYRESETVIQLTHPNTIQFYDFSQLDDGSLLIVMEYINGSPLADVLDQEGALPPDRVHRLLSQICGSLHEAHSRGIIHRDLKPENVLLSNRAGQTDFVKVLDFGIAKRDENQHANQTKLTMQGTILGTPPYMSPEQFMGQTLDARSDVYSLGVMTYEMLAGKLPFEANTPWEWATQHMTVQPSPFSTLGDVQAIDPSKQASVLKALAKDPNERHASVLAFLDSFGGQSQKAAAAVVAVPSNDNPVSAGGAQGETAVADQQAYPTTKPKEKSSTTLSGTWPTSSAGPKIIAAIATVLVLFIVAAGAAGLYFYWARTDSSQPIASANKDTSAAPAEPSAPPAGQTFGQPETQTQSPAALVPETAAEKAKPLGTPAKKAGKTRKKLKTSANAIADKTPIDKATAPDKTKPKTSIPKTPGKATASQTKQLLEQATKYVRANKTAQAAKALEQAQAALGRGHPEVKKVRSLLAKRASIQVGILIQQGRCTKAQQLYKQLRRVSAHHPSKGHFSPEWCKRP